MSKLETVVKAIRFASEHHAGQKDDCGESYFEAHLKVVGEILQKLVPDDANLIAAGYLHDIIEDTDITYEDLVREFNQDVADLVHEVTHEGAKDDYGFYFPRLHSQRGITLKLIDRASNISRMQSWNEKRKKQYLKKTKFWKDGSDRKL